MVTIHQLRMANFTRCWRRIAIASVFFGSLAHGELVTDLMERESVKSRAVVRASSSDAIPAPISIAPSQYWDGNDGAWSSFPLQMGGGKSSTQNVRVFVSTAAYNIWTVGAEGCVSRFGATCSDRRGSLFLANQSVTWIRNSIFETGIEANLGLKTTATAGYETVTLGWQGSGGPQLDHQVVFINNDERFWLGVFGVNPNPTNFTDLNAPQKSFMQSLYDSSAIPSVSYGYTAGNPYRLNKVFGSLTLGGYDTNRFSGGISWGMYADISRDLLVNVKSITTDGSSTTSNLLPGGQISAYVDSTIAALWLPESACSAFESAFGLTYNSTKRLYLLDGATHDKLVRTNPNVTISLTNNNQTVDIVLPYSAFDLNVSVPIVDNTQYYFPLQRAANDSQYTLGRTFLQEAYIIADYDRKNFTIAPCEWNPAKVTGPSIKSILSPNLTAVAAQQSQQSSGSSIGAGAIAGIVIGAVALIALIAALVFFLRRRRTKKHRQLAELSEKGDGTTEPSYDAKVADEHAVEASGSELNEMYAPHKPKAQEMDSPYKVDPNKHGYFEMNGGDTRHAGKTHEMDGGAPIYEMAGSEVQELPAGDTGRKYTNDYSKR